MNVPSTGMYIKGGVFLLMLMCGMGYCKYTFF